MWKRVLVAICISAAVLAGALVFFFSRPSVAVLEPVYPSGYDIIGPSLFTASYRQSSDPATADLVLVLPGAQVPDGIDGLTIGGSEADLTIDEGAMWMSALGTGRECILYEAMDSTASQIAEDLAASDDNTYITTYDGRISAENMNRMLSAVSDADRILMLTPATSIRLIRDNAVDAETILDYRDAAAIESTGIAGAVAVDWNRTIGSALSGNHELSYTLVMF